MSDTTRDEQMKPMTKAELKQLIRDMDAVFGMNQHTMTIQGDDLRQFTVSLKAAQDELTDLSKLLSEAVSDNTSLEGMLADRNRQIARLEEQVQSQGDMLNSALQDRDKEIIKSKLIQSQVYTLFDMVTEFKGMD